MIINSLRADNVLKYSSLKLEDIPEQGLIAVIGDNESGKSSIGESICFALFGRTFSLDAADLDKVIRWGESRCSIKLEFTTPDGQRYEVARFLDELGNHDASISRVGEQPMVRGVAEAQARLRDIIGFGYTEFIESFYLAQREITTPHPHSFAVKAMAGVDAFEKIVTSCEDELTQTEEKTAETERRKGDIEEQIEALGLEEGRLASLEVENAKANADIAEDREQISELKGKADKIDEAIDRLGQGAESWLSVPIEASIDQRVQQGQDLELLAADLEPLCTADEQTLAPRAGLATLARESREPTTAFDTLRQRADAYRSRLESLLGDAEPAADAAERTFAARRQELVQTRTEEASARRTSRILMFLFGLPALVLWGFSALLGLVPDSPQAQMVAGWLQGLSGGQKGMPMATFLIAATVLTLLFLGFLVRGIRQSARIRELKQTESQLVEEENAARREARDLVALDQMPLPQAVNMLCRIRDAEIAKLAADYREGAGATLLDPERYRAGQADFRHIVDALKSGLAQVTTNALLEIERRHESVAELSRSIANLEEMISQEQERVRRHRDLTLISQSLTEKIDGLRRRLRARELAIDLLQGAIHYISQRFNTDVRNLAADSLPKFTNGRYEHLQIDETLKVKAFSSEKRDFMDLDEISSGTQRQIMLAVRLSLSQKLVNSVIQGPQTLFLDEPFAFFDEHRTASALHILPQVSGDFTQIWVTSQTFPETSRFDLYIECNAREGESPSVRRGTGDDQPA